MLTIEIKVFVLSLSCLVRFTNGDISYETDEYETNKTCIIQHSGLQGICTPISQCINAQMIFKNHKIYPTNCYYVKLEPVVCCLDIFQYDLDHQNCRKSQIQCHKTACTGGEIFATDCWETECKKSVSKYGFNRFEHCKIDPRFAGNTYPERVWELPFMAAIGFKEFDENIVFNCAGFLVAPEFIVTAAHCTEYLGDIPIVVRTGGIDLDNNINSLSDTPIRQIFIHPLYKKGQAYHDIALIRLAKPSGSPPTCLANSKFANYTGKSVYSVGTGQDSYDSGSKKLLQIELSLIDIDECKDVFRPNINLPDCITGSQVCATDSKMKYSQDFCQSISGAPLLTFFDGAPKLFGVTTYAYNCDNKSPAVFARIDYYYDWLESIIWKDV